VTLRAVRPVWRPAGRAVGVAHADGGGQADGQSDPDYSLHVRGRREWPGFLSSGLKLRRLSRRDAAWRLREVVMEGRRIWRFQRSIDGALPGSSSEGSTQLAMELATRVDPEGKGKLNVRVARVEFEFAVHADHVAAEGGGLRISLGVSRHTCEVRQILYYPSRLLVCPRTGRGWLGGDYGSRDREPIIKRHGIIWWLASAGRARSGCSAGNGPWEG